MKEMTENDKEQIKILKTENATLKNVNLVDIDDTFEFECQRCGRCCMGRNDILINAFDVFNASKFLGITCSDFIDNYASMSLDGYSKIPIVTLGQDDHGNCHFLEFDYLHDKKFKCSINSAKPGACSHHPLGLVVKYSDPHDANKQKDDGYSFIKVDQCENSKKPVKQSVRQWMHAYLDNQTEVDASHEFIKTYMKHYSFRKAYFVSLFLDTAEAKFDKSKPLESLAIKAFGTMCNQIIHYTYVNYDTSKPFLEQCNANVAELDKLLSNSDKVFESVEGMVNNILKGAKLKGKIDHEITVDSIVEAIDKENSSIEGSALELAKRIRKDDKEESE